MSILSRASANHYQQACAVRLQSREGDTVCQGFAGHLDEFAFTNVHTGEYLTEESGGCMSREVVTTARLLVRPPREADRDRFVQLFRDKDFMVFYPDVLTEEQAGDRFDHMVAVCQTIPFGKQPVVELSSGLVVGYTGVDCIDFEDRTWLEWGYRLVPECRGLGYATEASQALLARARQTYAGELLAIIAPENLASQNVCRKLGFTFWKQAPVEGDIRNLYTLVTGRISDAG
jgi:RimJ/RimL family protein N-acetyltransferase